MASTKLTYKFFMNGRAQARIIRAYTVETAIDVAEVKLAGLPAGAKAAVIVWRDHFGNPKDVTIFSDGSRAEGLVTVRWVQ
jgi:hypothetical protein